MEKEINPQVKNAEKVALIDSVTKVIDVVSKIDLIANCSNIKEEFAALSIARFNLNNTIEVMLEVLEHRGIKFEDGKFYEQVASIEVETPHVNDVNFEENSQEHKEEDNE